MELHGTWRGFLKLFPETRSTQPYAQLVWGRIGNVPFPIENPYQFFAQRLWHSEKEKDRYNIPRESGWVRVTRSAKFPFFLIEFQDIPIPYVCVLLTNTHLEILTERWKNIRGYETVPCWTEVLVTVPLALAQDCDLRGKYSSAIPWTP